MHIRELEGVLVLLFFKQKATVKTDYSLSKAKINRQLSKPSLSKTLQPYEAVILELAEK
jgi:hypothetical protein